MKLFQQIDSVRLLLSRALTKLITLTFYLLALSMKTLFTTLVACCLTFTGIKAQENAWAKANPFKIGVFVGINYSSSILDYSDIKPLTGFLAGIDGQYALTNQASLHLQPSWTSAKSQSRYLTLNVSTFKLPLLYRHYIFPNWKGFFAQAGLSYNYLTSSNMRRQWDIVCIAAPCPNTGPDTPSSNKATVSGIAGIGYTIELEKITIPVTLQYERYFSNYEFPTRDLLNPSQLVGDPTRVKFDSFSLTTGINF